MAVFTALLFVATTGLWIFTGLLWRATKRAVVDAQTDSAEQAKRFADQLRVAQNGAEAAARSADAAQAAIAQASETAQKELRAYVVVEIGALNGIEAKSEPKGSITLKNVGRTPAYNVSSAVVVVWAKIGDRVSIPDPEDVQRTQLVIGPGLSKGHNMPAKFSLLETALSEIQEGSGGFIVGGCTVYEDVFGNTWNTQFCHTYTGPDLKGLYHPDLNRAT